MEFITTLFEALTAGITGIISPMVEAIKTGFLEVIYVDPTAETPVLSAIAYFLFAMLGLILVPYISDYICKSREPLSRVYDFFELC